MSNNIQYNSSFADVPLNLKLQQIITSSDAVTVPSGIKRVWALCIGGGGSGGMGNIYSNTTYTITNATSSIPITSVSINTPASGYTTFFTPYTPHPISSITLAGFTPTNYNGARTVDSVNPGVSFVAYTGQSTAVTTIGNYTGYTIFTIGTHSLKIHQSCSTSGITPTTLNISPSSGISAFTSTEIVLFGGSGTYTSGGTLTTQLSSGAGGAGGGIACGWTPVPTNCTVGLGGVVNTSNSNIIPYSVPGGTTIFGTVIAGGGGAGLPATASNILDNAGTITAGAQYLHNGSGSGTGGQKSFGTSNVILSQTNESGTSGGSSGENSLVLGGGGSNARSFTTTNLSGINGGSGVCGGGGSGATTTAVATGGNGGTSYFWSTYTGGNGSSGTGINFGAGGGGAGILANGSNASGINGGNGGAGGGGGGGSVNGGIPGNGGNGVIYLYY